MEKLITKCLVLLALDIIFGSPLVASLKKLQPPPGYERVRGGPGFLKLHREPLDWYDALVNCRLEGGTLASPLNSELTYSLLNITWGLPGTLVGVRAQDGRTYTTIEGVVLWKIQRWANWAVVVPIHTERCMILRPDGTLKAFYCNKKHPYVCFRNDSSFNTTGFNECGTLDDGYKYYKSTKTCYKIHRMGMPWARAVLSCQAEGGSLLIIKSNEEAKIASDIGFVPTTTKYVPRYSERTYISRLQVYWHVYTSIKQETYLVNPVTTTPPHPYYDQEIFLGLYRTDSTNFLTIHGKPYSEMKGYSQYHSSATSYHPSYLCGGYWPRNAKIYALQCHHFHRYICEKKP